METHIFEKVYISSQKSTFPVRPFLSYTIEHEKSQERFFEGPEGVLTTSVQDISLLLLDMTDRQNQLSRKRLPSR